MVENLHFLKLGGVNIIRSHKGTILSLVKPCAKGQTKSKWFFQANVFSKKRRNEFYFTTIKPQLDLFSFVFWRKLKTPKRHFEIIWPLPCDFTSNWQIEKLRNSLWNYNVKDLKYHFRMCRISLWKKEVAIIANPIETYLRSVYGLDLNLVLWASRWKSPAPGISPLSIRLFFLHAYRYRIPKKEA